MKQITSVIILLMISLTAQGAEWIVGVEQAEPFVYKQQGKWTGYDIELVEQIAKNQNRNVKFVEYNSTPELLEAVKNKEVDFAISTISVTAPREKYLDFSYSYFSTTPGLLTYDNHSTFDIIWWVAVRVITVIAILIVGMYIVGFIIDKVDGNENIRNPHEGAWWALVTFTTTGYGDIVPKTPRGKIIAAIWMISSLMLLSAFTGYLASALTVKQLTQPTNIVDRVKNKKVAVIKGTTGASFAKATGFNVVETSNVKQALFLLNRDHVSGIIYDKAVLNNFVNEQFTSVRLLDYDTEYYAIAFKQGSPLRETINTEMLKVLRSPFGKFLKQKYFH